MNDRDERFAQEYLIDLNAMAAAIRAGYAPSTARNAAAWIRSENPSKPALRKRIDQLMAERSRRTGISADRVLRELAKIAFVNAEDVIDPETARVKPHASRDDKAAIASVSVKTGKIQEREIRLCDKPRALELLGRHLGLFADNVKVEGAMPVIIDDAGPSPTLQCATGARCDTCGSHGDSGRGDSR